MNLKDRLWFMKNHICEKRNYLFIAILFFIFIAIFITLTFYHCATYISYYEKEKLTSKTININNYSKEKVELIKTELIQKEGEKRLVPVNIENSNYQINIDYIIMALGGTVSDETLELGLTLNKWGNILIDENYQTSDKQIFAGGDLAGVKGTVAWAARSGRDVAENIIRKMDSTKV